MVHIRTILILFFSYHKLCSLAWNNESLTHLLGLLGQRISQSKVCTCTGQQNTKEFRHTAMVQVGFEHSILVFVLSSTICILGRVATMSYYLAWVWPIEKDVTEESSQFHFSVTLWSLSHRERLQCRQNM